MTTFLNNAKLVRNPEKLAEDFLRVYFKNEAPVYPLNPFQMLKDMGVYDGDIETIINLIGALI